MIVGIISVSSGGVVALQQQQVNAQNTAEENLTSTTTTTADGNKNYILVFGQRIVGNIDNSTKIVSSIVGYNSVKIQGETVGVNCISSGNNVIWYFIQPTNKL
jgi:hypothetical protein